jgi:hypothetical protein
MHHYYIFSLSTSINFIINKPTNDRKAVKESSRGHFCHNLGLFINVIETEDLYMHTSRIHKSTLQLTNMTFTTPIDISKMGISNMSICRNRFNDSAW